MKLDVTIPKAGRAYLKITYELIKAMPLIPEGHVLGFDEILLGNEDGRNQTAVRWLKQERDADAAVGVTETDGEVILRGRGFEYVYDKKKGFFISMNYGGREYLDSPMELNIWRAPVDNDMYLKHEWDKAQYRQACPRAYVTVVEPSKDGVLISSVLSVSASSVQRMMDIKAVWTVDNSGGIYSSLDVVRNSEFPELPRFGVRLFLNRKLENVSYYGYGPMESYCDKHQAASHGLYRARVTDLHEDYIRPQENGSRFDCDYVEVCNGQFGLAAVSEQRFSFNASVYTQEELEEKAHNFELEESGSTVLCLDYALNGIGSNSCGPKILERYRFDSGAFCFRFKLVPFVRGKV